MNKIAAILWCILSLAWTTASWAQNVAVSGKVTGANGEAIIGANVLVEGTTQGITTNVDGDYTLTNVPANATLVVSYLGYKTEKIPVGNKTRIDVTLREVRPRRSRSPVRPPSSRAANSRSASWATSPNRSKEP